MLQHEEIVRSTRNTSHETMQRPLVLWVFAMISTVSSCASSDELSMYTVPLQQLRIEQMVTGIFCLSIWRTLVPNVQQAVGEHREAKAQVVKER